MCPAFCSFGAILFIVNLLMKTSLLHRTSPRGKNRMSWICSVAHANKNVFVFLLCLNMFVMRNFLLKLVDLEDILCYFVEFCVLSEIHASKTRFKQINENLKLKRPCTHQSGNLCTKFHTLIFTNN